MRKGLPQRRELLPVLYNEDECREFLISQGILECEHTCPDCRMTASLNKKRWTFAHRCRGRMREVTWLRGTFFAGSHLSCCETMALGYDWLLGLTHDQIVADTGHARQTVTDFIGHFNQLVSNCIPENACVIGGPGIIVEIDESKLAKRKHNRGHHVEGVWVVGGVELTSERRLFLVPVERRDSETLAQIIEEHVAAGSIIRTDCWKGYAYLGEDENYTHETVNHTRHFKDPTTGVHTNTIEGTWAAVKMQISRRYRTESGIGEHLFTVIWRRLNVGNLWGSFLACLKECKYLQ